MEEVILRVRLPKGINEDTRRAIERELELEALRIYLELKSKKKREKRSIEEYMGVFGEASPEELDAYSLEAEGFEDVH
ncbi:hypothetical protein [Thermococcus sp. 21S7]|uniref:hypothetical protein n=1 Tax=Thermococcus sp. 21S7 TaxID=1638221 RepID=UPI00143BF648|nr:hypothetical protein [Thermococcus sp. 21S7]NJE61299.1 hypothetical protein [Thermococcus sp. 21S7]